MRRTAPNRPALLLCIPTLLAGADIRALVQQAETRIAAEEFAAAETLLLDARRNEPANIEVVYRIGYVRYRQRKLAEARADFVQVVKTAPPAYYSRYFLGRIALLENRPREAVTWLEPVASAGEPVFDTQAQLAAAYARAGLRAKAIAALQAAIAAAPWDASLYYRLGRLHMEAGNKELAAEAFDNNKRLSAATREDVETLTGVAQLLSKGDVAAALRAGAQIRDRGSADPNALVALGVIFGRANLPAEALDAFARAAEREPRFFQAQYNRGLALLKLNRAEEALDALAIAVELLPQSPDAGKSFGLAAVMGRRYRDAIGPLERAWLADAADPRVGALLATAYLRTGDARKAAEVLSAPAVLQSGEPAPLLLRVEALNAAEDPEGALRAARQAAQRFPRLPQASMALAQQLARMGRYRDAQPVFEATLKLAPGYPEAELGLADTLSKSGDHASAEARYRAAMMGPGTAVAARSGLARSLVALRRLDEARELLEQSVAAHPAEAALHIELSRVYARLGKPDLAAEQTKIVEKLREEGKQP
jgi:cellulose synthase operon protein C